MLLKSAKAAGFISLLLVGIFFVSLPGAEKSEKASKEKTDPCKSFYHNSLHATGGGMKYWYENENGLMNLTGIPYDKLGCKNCHANSCDRCHAEKKDGKMTFSVEAAKKTELCIKCHSRYKVTKKLDKAKGITDVHDEAGLTCLDCHPPEDIHGDGNKYKCMRTNGAVKAKCTNCHEDIAEKNNSHKQHYKDIDCNACHVSNTASCLNCHFGEFLRTGKKPGNFVPVKEWLLLVNYNGKVTSGNVQTAYYEGKKFVTYVPYFTHSVMKKGRTCENCHGVDTAVKLAKGEKIVVNQYKDGKMTNLKGIIPFVEGLVGWTFLDKKDGKWIPVQGNTPDLVQKACSAKPMSKEQVNKLAQPQKK